MSVPVRWAPLMPPPPFDHSQVSPCCYDWSHSSVLPEISWANKHCSRESESSDERDTREITRSRFLNLHEFGPGCAAAVLLHRPLVATLRNNTLTPLFKKKNKKQMRQTLLKSIFFYSVIFKNLARGTLQNQLTAELTTTHKANIW